LEFARRDETLDPLDWREFRGLAHRMVDDMVDHLATLRERPAWQEPPGQVRENLREPVPLEAQPAEQVYEQFRSNVMPYTNGNLDPRFWGWVQGNGTPLAMMADMLASGIDPHMSGFNQSPKLVELQVIDWLKELMGFPSEASGVLVGGGTMANVLGLCVARHAKAGFDVNALGLQDRSQPPLVFYGSVETHNWAKQAAGFLGLGSNSFRLIPTDSDYRIDLNELENAVSYDRAQGLRPLCIIGTAGTVNTGAIDDLEALSALSKKHGLWFHVDGAFGALVKLSPNLVPLVKGLELADSVAFDLHKWGYLPFEVACILVRDERSHVATFAGEASYLARLSRGVTAGGLPFADRGIDLTRGFKALKVWMCFKAYGITAIARMIEQNVGQAHYLARLIQAAPELELLAPVPLNVVCFRYVPPGRTDDELNGLNQEILLRLQEQGIAVPSSTVLGGRFAIRVAVTNHRSKLNDFEELVRQVVRLGREACCFGP